MSRRDVRGGDYPLTPLPPPSKCAKFLYYTWKLCSVVFSHFVMISLVVAYCILGAVTFEKLEAEHEREVKKNISKIRDNTTQSIWWMTKSVPLLNQTNWTSDVVDMLKDFENSILFEMKVRGWDGSETTDHIQWTFTGALFYSIIVITTIGYGHIAPKTQTGKVVTIFYAILGIPLMLLCLSNIGDVMASSFRFLYWRVCCYVCTRPPKRRSRHRHASTRRSVRGGSTRGSTRRGRRKPVERAHSDTDCRYRDSGYSSGRGRARPGVARAGGPGHARTRSQPPSYNRDYGARPVEVEDFPSYIEKLDQDDFYDDDDSDFPKISLPLQDLQAALRDLDEHSTKPESKQELRSRSLPRPAKSRPDYGPRRDYQDPKNYDNSDLYEMHDLHDVDYDNFKERQALEEREKKRNEREYYKYAERRYDPDEDECELNVSRPARQWQDRRNRGRSEHYERGQEVYDDVRDRRDIRARSAVCEYERRWEGGTREGRRRDVEEGRGRRLRRLQTVDDTHPQYRHSPSLDRDDTSEEVAVVRRGRPTSWHSRQPEIHAVVPDPSGKEGLKPVPIWLCVLLVASYIVVGTFLFKRWESWAYLDAAYFCFITLTTIGFGDFVPAQGQTGDATAAVHSIALCSLYLLFGIALLAMSFNLVQEEVRANVAALATKLGIIKPKETYSDDDDTDY